MTPTVVLSPNIPFTVALTLSWPPKHQFYFRIHVVWPTRNVRNVFILLVDGVGVEPTFTESESIVLPLNEPPCDLLYNYNPFLSFSQIFFKICGSTWIQTRTSRTGNLRAIRLHYGTIFYNSTWFLQSSLCRSLKTLPSPIPYSIW